MLVDLLKRQSTFRVAFLFGTKIIGGVALLVTHVLISRAFGLEQYGFFSFFIASSLLIGGLTHGGWQNAIIPLLKRYETRERWGRYRGVLKQSLLTTIALSLLISICVGTIGYALIDAPLQRQALLVSCLLGPVYALSAVTKGILRSVDRPHISALAEEVIAPTFYVLFLLAVGVSTIVDAMLVFFSLMFLVVLLSVFWAMRTLPTPAQMATSQSLVIPWAKYTLPLLASDLGNAAIARTDIVVLTLLSQATQTGYYSASYRIASVLLLASVCVDPLFLSRFAQTRVSRDLEAGISLLVQATLLSVAFVIIPYTLIMIFPHKLLGYFGQEFSGAALTLRILATAFFFQVATGPAALFIVMYERQKSYAQVTLLTGLMNIVLCYLLVIGYGAEGVAFAIFATFFTGKLLVYFDIYRMRHDLGPGLF